MTSRRLRLTILFSICCWTAGVVGQTVVPPEDRLPGRTEVPLSSIDAAEPQLESPEPESQPEDRYAELRDRHRLEGRASYYSDFFNGRQTANGEVFRQTRFSAAHRTLPLGCWVVVKSLATGRKVRVKVNDRGPFTGGFVIDLSRIAARALGVDRAADRRVEIKVVAMPGEDPPPVLPDERTGQITTVAEIAP